MGVTNMASRISLRSIAAILVGAVATTLPQRALAATNEGSPDASDVTPSAASPDESADGTEAEEEVATNEPAKKTVSGKDKTHSHRGQFNVRLALGGSYRIVMRYDDSPPCSMTANQQGEQKIFCGFGAPLSLDTAIGYAPIAGVEPFLWGRFGLTRETVSNTAPLVIVGAGARIYTMSDSAFKFFIEPAVGLELDKAAKEKTNRTFLGQPVQYKQDFIVRLSIGPQLDFARYFGAYVAAGLTVGMLRSLQSWMDLHVGVQARFP